MTKEIYKLYKEKTIDTANILSIEDAKKISKGKKTIIVTGVTGQDGSFMVDYLLKHTDYLIFGGVRRLSVYNHSNIKHLRDSNRFHLINFDLSDSHGISRLIEYVKPEYFINFAAQSFVGCSWDFARQTWQVNATAILDILEAIRLYKPDCRLYQAGSSEEFGDVLYSPQDENHPLRPRSPYGASKAGSRQLIKVYRESYGLYAVQGWLFNHEGVRRGEEFVTRKISKNVARIKKEIDNGSPIVPMELGNIDSKRDWSDAEDFVEGVWRMLNQNNTVKDYVLSSNETHTIREFVEKAFISAGIPCHWSRLNLDRDDNRPENEVLRKDTGEILMKINTKFYRPAEVDLLLGDSTAARAELGWDPKTSFGALVEKMVKNDMNEI
jgi:GDPmannose 4,6-dehydratase